MRNKMYTLVLTITLTIIICLLFVEYATKLYLSNVGNINTTYQEFPKIYEHDLEKFSSFDSELGWVRQPNEKRKKDTSHQGVDRPDSDAVVYSTDKYGSRVCENYSRQDSYNISTYGDSYCFCRDVNDNETFQHYLSEELETHVSNYGVGNYGPDQSVIRMKRTLEDDPADYVILALHDTGTVSRALSSWKHYFEYGNTFAMKPRFELLDGELKLIPIPIEKRIELLSIEDHADYLRRHDYHYKNWWLPNTVDSPFIKYWFQSPYHIPHSLSVIPESLTRDNPKLTNIHNYFELLRRKIEQNQTGLRSERVYNGICADENLDLFIAILKEFSEFVNKKNSTPVFLPMQHYDVYKFPGHDPLSKEKINIIRDNCPNLHVVDPREEIKKEVDSINDLYMHENPLHGHPSTLHNRLIANHLANFILEHKDRG